MTQQAVTDAATQCKTAFDSVAALCEGILAQAQAKETTLIGLVEQARLQAVAAQATVVSGDPDIAAFFTGYSGVKLWVDPATTGARWQDAAGTTAITAAGQPVGRLTNLSGAGPHLIQATAGSRPTYGTEGGRSYVSGDGVADGLYSSAAIDLTSTNKITLIMGVKKRAGNGTFMMAELGSAFTGGGAFGLYIVPDGPQGYFNGGASGATNTPSPVIASATPDLAVVTLQVDLSNTPGWAVKLQRNNDVITDTVTAGNRNFISAVLNVLCRDNASLFAPVDLYSFMLLGGAFPSDANLLMLQRYTAAKTGITL